MTTAGKRAGESISHTETFRPRPRLCRRELLAPFEGRSHRLSRIRRCKRTESLINLSFYPMPCDRRIRVSIARTCESTCVKRANVARSIAIYLTAMKISTLYFFIKLYGTLGVIEHSTLCLIPSIIKSCSKRESLCTTQIELEHRRFLRDNRFLSLSLSILKILVANSIFL